MKSIIQKLFNVIRHREFNKITNAIRYQTLRLIRSLKKESFRAVHSFNHLPHRRLSPELWDMSCGPTGHLMIQSCDALALAKEYGTPLYIVDKRRLERNYFDFLNSFQALYPRIEIAYSYKTNPLPRVLKALHSFGAMAEVVSHFELWLALELGVLPENIIYNGPGKTEDSLTMAVSNGIRLININDLTEADIIERVAQKHGKRQQVGVRVVPSKGWSGKFGVPIRDGAAFRVFQHLVELEHVIPCALHFHLGTHIKDIDIYLQAIREVLDLAILVKTEIEVSIRYFDFGGGFSVPTVRPYSEIDHELFANDFPAWIPKAEACPLPSEYGRKIIDLFREFNLPEATPPTIILEPGRAITSSAQSLLLTVLALKPEHTRRTNVILDGGTNVALPPTYEYHEVFVVSKMDATPEHSYRIFGPLCHPGDVLFSNKKLPQLEVGDILAIMDAGAYFVPAQQNFSFPRPPVVWVENGHHEVIRIRESFNNIISLDQY